MVVVCGGCGKHATAALAYSLVVAVEDPTDRGPRTRRPISRGLGWDVGFNRRLVQSDWKTFMLASIRRDEWREAKKDTEKR
jgi:hypothetical protein